MSNQESESNLKITDVVRLRRRHYLGLLGMGSLTVMPFLLTDIWLFQLSGILFFAGFVVAWDLISGYTGKVSFGHSAFLGAGGYTSAILNLNTELGLIMTIIIGTLVAGAIGLLVGIPTLRIEGPYFALFTVIIPMVMLGLLSVFPDTLGGEIGLTGVERITSDVTFTYYLGLAVFFIIFLTSYLVVKSNAGIIFTSIREDHQVVSAVGINPNKFKIFAFTMSALLIGFAGAVYVHTEVGGASPTHLLVLAININILLAGMLGGLGNLTGAAVGGMFFMVLREMVRRIEMTVPVVAIDLGSYSTELFYLLIILFVLLIPQGIIPLLEDRSKAERQ